jgi:hypothetical protein
VFIENCIRWKGYVGGAFGLAGNSVGWLLGWLFGFVWLGKEPDLMGLEADLGMVAVGVFF